MRLLVFLLVATLAFAATGCGSSNTKALSHDEYAAKADAICRKFNRQFHAVGDVSDLPKLAAALDKLVPLFEKALDDLDALTPPESEQATADRWLDQSNSLKDDLKEIRDKAKVLDGDGVEVAQQSGARDVTQANKLAHKLGMRVCDR